VSPDHTERASPSSSSPPVDQTSASRDSGCTKFPPPPEQTDAKENRGGDDEQEEEREKQNNRKKKSKEQEGRLKTGASPSVVVDESPHWRCNHLRHLQKQ